MSRLRLLLVLLMLPFTSACVPSLGADTITVTALFPSASGLFVGNDVGVLGVSVGKITDIDPEGVQVRVTMQIAADQAVPSDVGAVIAARSVATDRYVELTPVYDSGPKLRDGDSIGLERTRTPVEFDEVLEALNTFATGIAGSKESTDAIRRLIESGSAALDGRGDLFNSTVTDLADAVTSVSGQRGDISATLRSLDQLIGTIALNQQTARTFIDQVSRVSGQLDDQRVDFRTALRALDRAVTTVAAFAVDHRNEIVDAIGGTSTLMKTMLSRQRELTSILETFPLALQNLRLAAAGERIPVRVAFSVLLPFGDEISQICESLPLGLCGLISGTDPTPAPSPRGARP